MEKKPKKEKRRYRTQELFALYFDKLPQRCKEIFFEYMSNYYPSISDDKSMLLEILPLDNVYESPIEQIFDFAYQILIFDRGGTIPDLFLESQEWITVANKDYRADFYYDTEYNFKCHYKCEHDFKLIIECDGHNFHEKTKKQVKYNNERDYNLKNAGYDILHFSGSQIFNEPFKCANNTMNYILSKIGRWEKL